MNDENLKNKIVNATKWSTITEVVAKLVAPVTNMILARVISPEAFGVVSTTTMVMSFSDMITDAGFQKYLVQHKFKDEEEKIKNTNVAFWTNIFISLFLWIIIIVFRDQIATLVGNPGLGNVIAIVCMQLLLTSFSSIQMALYRREFNFKTLFRVRMVGILMPIIVTIPLAFLGLSYWAIIIGAICTQISNAIILTVKSKWKPYFFYDFRILKEMLSFSVWSLIEALSIWLTGWIDVFIIASSLNQYYLGIYKISTSTVSTLMSLITASILPIFFSALSRLQDDDDKFKSMYFTTQRIVSIFVLPFGVGLYLYSEVATEILLGNSWIEASSLIGVWGITSAIKIIFCNLSSEVYRAKGRPKLSFLSQVLHLIVLIPSCLISVKYGFWVLVYVRAWIRMQFVFVNLIIMKLEVGIKIGKTFKNIIPIAISAISMGGIAYILQKLNDGLVWSILSIIICALFYFCLLYLFPSTKNDINKFTEGVKAKYLKYREV